MVQGRVVGAVMKQILAQGATAGLGLAGLIAASAMAAPTGSTPKIVTAYAAQMAAMCPASAPVAPDRADLNGDGRLDWVFDSNRQSCAATSSMAKTYGSLVTVFLATPQGDAAPAFQQAAFGAHLERIAGKTRLILTLAGVACGETKPEARCERAVSWAAGAKRFELAQATPAAKSPAGAQAKH